MRAQEQLPEAVQTTGNVTAVGTAVGTIAGWLPSIAALFTIIWLGVQIYESKTGQRAVTYLRGKKGDMPPTQGKKEKSSDGSNDGSG